MPRRYHLPTAVRWTDETSFGASLDRELIGDIVLAAVARALADAPGGSAAVSRLAGLDEQPAARFDPARFRADRASGDATYAIPSFGHGGRPVGLPVRSPRSATAERRSHPHSAQATAANGLRLPHPSADPATDRFLQHASPFSGRPFLEIPGRPPILLGGTSHGSFGSLRRALDVASVTFDGVSFAVLEGPWPIGPESRVTVVPTELPVGSEELEETPREGWRLEVHDAAGAPHLVRAVVGLEGEIVAPPDTLLQRELTNELAAPAPTLPPRPSPPAPLPDPIPPADSTIAASSSPIFLLEAPVRLAWLEALLAGRLDDAGRAIVWQLLASFGDPPSLAAALTSLRRSGRTVEILDDPGAALSLLIHIGTVSEQKRERPSLNLGTLLETAGFPLSDDEPVAVDASWIDVALRHFGPPEGLDAGMARVRRLAEERLVTASGDAALAWRGLHELAPEGALARRLAWLVVWALAAGLGPLDDEAVEEPWPIELIVEF